MSGSTALDPRDAACNHIASIEKERQRLDDLITTRVAHARRYGASRSQIGRALGMSKQAAQKRYDRRLF